MIIAYIICLIAACFYSFNICIICNGVLFCLSSSYSPERVQQIRFNLFQFIDYVKDHFSTFQWNQTIVDDLQALYHDGERDRICEAYQVRAFC